MLLLDAYSCQGLNRKATGTDDDVLEPTTSQRANLVAGGRSFTSKVSPSMLPGTCSQDLVWQLQTWNSAVMLHFNWDQ